MGSKVNLHVASFFFSDETIHGPARPLLLTDVLLPSPRLLVLDDLHTSFGRGRGERGRGQEEGGEGKEGGREEWCKLQTAHARPRRGSLTRGSHWDGKG